MMNTTPPEMDSELIFERKLQFVSSLTKIKTLD